MNRVDRLMAYLLLFQSRGLLRAQDFAAEFEISERTVYRDMQALSEMGVPLIAMPGEGYQLMEGYYLPPITFTAPEARSLYLALSMLAGLTTPGATQTAAQAALDKIRTVLPQATLRQVEALQAITHFYAMPGNALDFDNKTFLTLQEAIYQRQVVHLHYHALHTNAVTERDVEPLELMLLDKAWLLRGYCRLRQETRAFRLDRIDKLLVQAETFSLRPAASPNPPASEPVTIQVRFDSSVVRWVKERQHYSLAEEQPSADKGVVMVYLPRDFEQIEGWLLSWGDKMTVLEPPALRARLAATAAQILAHHQTG